MRFDPGRCDESDAVPPATEDGADDDDDEEADDEDNEDDADADEDDDNEVEDDDTAVGFASCFLTAYVRSMVRGFKRAREK